MSKSYYSESRTEKFMTEQIFVVVPAIFLLAVLILAGIEIFN